MIVHKAQTSTLQMFSMYRAIKMLTTVNQLKQTLHFLYFGKCFIQLLNHYKYINAK